MRKTGLKKVQEGWPSEKLEKRVEPDGVCSHVCVCVCLGAFLTSSFKLFWLLTNVTLTDDHWAIFASEFCNFFFYFLHESKEEKKEKDKWREIMRRTAMGRFKDEESFCEKMPSIEECHSRCFMLVAPFLFFFLFLSLISLTRRWEKGRAKSVPTSESIRTFRNLHKIVFHPATITFPLPCSLDRRY